MNFILHLPFSYSFSCSFGPYINGPVSSFHKYQFTIFPSKAFINFTVLLIFLVTHAIYLDLQQACEMAINSINAVAKTERVKQYIEQTAVGSTSSEGLYTNIEFSSYLV